MTRTEILEMANDCVMGQRGRAYGSPEDNFSMIAELWTAYMRTACVSPDSDVCIRAKDVAAMMGLLKIARVSTGNSNLDNWIDLAGYAACGGEIDCKDC